MNPVDIKDQGSSDSSSTPLSNGDISRLVQQVISEASLDGIELGSFTHQQLKELAKSVEEHGEPLSQNEREAFERQQKSVIKDVLKRLAQKKSDVRQAEKQPGDGLTASRPRPEPVKASAQTRLPSEGPQEEPLKLVPRDQPTQASSRDKNLARSHVAHNLDPAIDPNGFRKLCPSPPDKPPRTLNQLKIKLWALSHARSPSAKVGGAYRSPGKTLPPLQFFNPPYHQLAAKLGIQSLSDLLLYIGLPEGRLLLSQALGVPVPTLLAAAWRAELLDLPLPDGHHGPHLKDILLLSKLGIDTLEELASLAEIFGRHPAKLTLLAKLIQQYQRHCPAWVARRALSGKELRQWAQAATKRPSAITIATTGPLEDQSLAEFAAEKVVWHQKKFLPREATDVFNDALGRLLMASGNFHLSEQIWQEILIECGDANARRWRDMLENDRRQALLEERRQEFERYEAYLLGTDDPSLLFDLQPLLGADPAREDGLICFWMEPAADSQHAMARAPDAEGERPPSALYVCLDPKSGAVAPFGG
jgi:hypothetical protein